MPSRNQRDKALIRRVMAELAVGQQEIADRLGKTQSAISWVMTRGTNLSQLDRRELESWLAQDKALGVARQLREAEITGSEVQLLCVEGARMWEEGMPENWFEHLRECEQCMGGVLVMVNDLAPRPT